MPELRIRRVNIAKIVGSPFCVSIEDGARVHNAIVEAFERGERVAISFAGVERLTTAFLNAAVGQLYDTQSEDRLREALMPPEDATQEQLRLLVRVVENARAFFASPARHQTIIDRALDDE